jgi:mannitol/fructose-specific phosphotransferase system IIA component (Ntr-type)
MANGLNGLNFASLFSAEDILPRTEMTSRDEVLTALLQRLAERNNIKDTSFAFRELVAREEQSSTIIGSGVAMPHARLHDLNRLLVGVATSAAGIIFDKNRDDPVHLVILILVPVSMPGLYLQAASSLAKMLREPGAALRAAEFSSAEDVWRFFSRGALILPDYVCAGDIMSHNIVSVQETDPIKTAINMFVKSDLPELPVVDKDGDLVGMVSEHELLRVCLPDHILWMEDLSPIINFEPFAEILKNEATSCLTDIMTDDYAMVQENAPAIEVAKALRTQSARHVFVVRGKKLVGVISLQDFITKVLRE